MVLLIIIIEITVIYLMFHIASNTKLNIRYTIGAILVTYFSSVIGAIAYRPLSAVIGLLCLSIYTYRVRKAYIDLGLTVAIMAFAQLGNSLGIFAGQRILGSEFNVNRNTESFLIFISIEVFTYLVGGLILKRRYRVVKSFFEGIALKAQRIIIAILYVVYLITYFGVYYIAVNRGHDMYLLIILIVGFATSFIAVLINYNGLKQAELIQREEALRQRNNYIKQIEQINADAQRTRHDYKNILTSIYGYILQDDLEGAKRYMDEFVLPNEERMDTDIRKIGRLINLSDHGLKGLISIKLTHAIQLGLSVDIHVPTPVPGFKMNLMDLNRVVGILLDNAIEGAMASEGKKMRVRLEYVEERTIIHIENSIDEQMSLNKMFEEGFTTKKHHAGVGLATVRELLNRNGIGVDTNFEGYGIVQVFSVPNGE